MRVRPILFAVTGLALVASQASAMDNLLDDARKGQGRRGQAPAPVRAPRPSVDRSPRAPAPRFEPRRAAPAPQPQPRPTRVVPDRAPSGGRTVLGGGQRDAAPVRTTPRSSGFFRGGDDDAPGGRAAPRAPVKVPPAAKDPAPRDSGSSRGDGFFRDRAPGFRRGDDAPPRRVKTSDPAPQPTTTAPAGTVRVSGDSGDRTRGGSGFLDRAGDRLRNGPAAKAPRVGGFGSRPAAGGAAVAVATTTTTTVSTDTYRSGWRNGYRVGYRDGSCGWYHDWYDRHRWYLSFSFGASCGPFYGVTYYRPFHSFVLGLDYAFFYPAPVTYCYVPYGFYSSYSPIYVTRYEYVRVPTVVYEERVTYTTEEIETRGPAGGDETSGEPKAADPQPAAGSPATEKFLREASDHFRKKEYYEAAVKFRLAALSSPELPGPLFALGQSLMAMGQDAYAARVTRKAVEMSPKLLEETGDVAGVFADQAEFDRVMKELEARAEAAPADGDARFLLAAERFFTGDVRCREAFDALHVAQPMDEAVEHFRAAAAKRFKSANELPAIPK